VLILLMIGILIAAGCVMETTPNIVILAPILKPLADNIGMNEIQFCIMMITALGVGFITPPLGSTCSWSRGSPASRSSRSPTGRAIRVLHARVVLLIAYVPAISTTFFQTSTDRTWKPCP
jgi:C4-dicarboxylate transporter DctM subunit